MRKQGKDLPEVTQLVRPRAVLLMSPSFSEDPGPVPGPAESQFWAEPRKLY